MKRKKKSFEEIGTLIKPLINYTFFSGFDSTRDDESKQDTFIKTLRGNWYAY